jgi:GDPmannose 4,6-dehydratase
VIRTFGKLGIELEFRGEGRDEKGYISQCNDPRYQVPKGKLVVGIHPRYFRPAEVDTLIGDASKAKEKLGWEPKYSLDDMITEMIHEDLRKTSTMKF